MQRFRSFDSFLARESSITLGLAALIASKRERKKHNTQIFDQNSHLVIFSHFATVGTFHEISYFIVNTGQILYDLLGSIDEDVHPCPS